MKVLTHASLAGSVVALFLLGACSPKKTFKGGTISAAAEEPAPEGAPYEEVSEGDAVPEVPAKESTNIFKNCETSTTSNFMGELYRLPKDTKVLPSFPSLKPVKSICLKQIDIATRKFTEGFPGVEGLYEWFALNMKFNLQVEKAGEYKFRVNSDDGSKLFIDGKEVIENDGQHSPRSREGRITLTAGSHKVNLQYFQGPADEIALELFWTPPGGTEAYVPSSVVSRD